MRSIRIPWLDVTVWCLVALAILLRFAWLPWMEFKGDEFTAMVRTYQHLQGDIALVGLSSSLGLFHPPFFLYVLSIPMLVTRDPVAVTAFFAMLNVAGLACWYVFVRRHFSSVAALWTTALASSAPWAIVFSRKIWSPDLIFPFVAAFLLAFGGYLRSGKPWMLYLSAFFLALVTHMHLSGFFLLPAFVVFVPIAAPRLRVRDAAIASVVFLLTYAPFVWHFLVVDPDAINRFLSSSGGGFSRGDAVDGLRWTFSIMTGLRFDYLLGESGMDAFLQRPLIMPALAVFGVAVLCMAVGVGWMVGFFIRPLRSWLAVRSWPPSDRLLLLLLLFFVSLHVAYAILGVPPVPHYYLLCFPIPVLTSVLLLERLQALHVVARIAGSALLLVIVVAQLWFSVSFLHFVRTQPERIAGDYGRPYFLERVQWSERLKEAFGTER